MKNTVKTPNWIPLPDPLTEEEVNIQITWTADAGTTAAIERQAKKLGFDSPTDYLQRTLADVIANDEEDTILANDGRLLRACDGYGEDGPVPLFCSPLMEVFIGVSRARFLAFERVGEPAPQPKAVRALIDTGSQYTIIDSGVTSALSIQPSGSKAIHTPTTGGDTVLLAAVEVSIYFPLRPPWSMGALQALVATLSPQGIDAVIGRDVLQYTRFVYDPRAVTFSLTFW
jgi:hypothetical protein